MSKGKKHVKKLKNLIENPSLEAFNQVMLNNDNEITIKTSEIDEIFKNNSYEEGMKLINKKLPYYKELMNEDIRFETSAESGSSGEYLHDSYLWHSLDSFIRSELKFLQKLQELKVLDDDYILVPGFFNNFTEESEREFFDSFYEYFCIPKHYATDEAYMPDEIVWESKFKTQDLLNIRMLSMQIYDIIINYLFR